MNYPRVYADFNNKDEHGRIVLGDVTTMYQYYPVFHETFELGPILRNGVR